MADPLDKRQPIDFKMSKPEVADDWRKVTDPIGAAERERGIVPGEYPKVLARHADAHGHQRDTETAINAEHEADLRDQGYMTHHELDRVKAPKVAEASKPEASATPKPAAKKKAAAKKPTGKQATGPAKTTS